MPQLPHAPAAEQNKRPILAAIRPRLRDVGLVLEIGSGSGQHAEHFAAALAEEYPALRWQPSDLAEQLPGLAERVRRSGLGNLLPPLALDLRSADWPVERCDACYTANTLHIISWAEVGALFTGVSARLPAAGELLVYGPFLDDVAAADGGLGRGSAASNLVFDRALRHGNPHRGVRQLADLCRLGAGCALRLAELVEMPRDNLLLVFRREPEA